MLYRLYPQELIVFEGPDNTGKSTLIDALRELFPHDLCTHQPSGHLPLTQAIYKLTEEVDEMNNLSRQLLHLASHVEHYEKMVAPELRKRGVFMDRCYISTMVYGYYNGDDIKKRISPEEFWVLCQLPAGNIRPKVVFYCEHVYAPDKHNTPGVLGGYQKINRQMESMVVVPPYLGPLLRAEWCADYLVKRGHAREETTDVRQRRRRQHDLPPDHS